MVLASSGMMTPPVTRRRMASSTVMGNSTTLLRGTTSTYPLKEVGVEGTKTVTISSGPVSARVHWRELVTRPMDQMFLLVGLDGDHARALKLVLAIGEEKIGDLLDGGIDGANERNSQDGTLGDTPEGAADEIAHEYADEVEEDDG